MLILQRKRGYTRTRVLSRQYLMPWFACLFVTEEQRDRGIAGSLLEHGLNETKMKGFDKGLAGANNNLEMALNKCLIDGRKKYH